MLKKEIKALYKRTGHTAKSLSIHLGMRETYISKGITQGDYVSRPMCKLLTPYVQDVEPDNHLLIALLRDGASRPRPTTAIFTPYEDDWTDWLKVHLLDKLNSVEYQAASPYVRGAKRTSDKVYAVLREHVREHIPTLLVEYLALTHERMGLHSAGRIHKVNDIIHATMDMSDDDLNAIHELVSYGKV